MYDTPEYRVWSERPPDHGPTPATQSPEYEARPDPSQNQHIGEGEIIHDYYGCQMSGLDGLGIEHMSKTIRMEPKTSVEITQTGQVTPVNTPGSFNSHFVIDLTGEDSPH